MPATAGLRRSDGQDARPPLALLGWLAVVNGFLLVFNLVPAFPLDGGRIARAVAWKITGDRSRGTRFSARLGQGFAYLLIGLGIFLLFTSDPINGLWFAVLGWFLGQAARGAVATSRFTERLDGVTVADVMDAEPVCDAGRRAGRARRGRVLPALPLALVPGRRRLERALPRPRAAEQRRGRDRGRPARGAGPRPRRAAPADDGEALSVRSDAPIEHLLGSEAPALAWARSWSSTPTGAWRAW